MKTAEKNVQPSSTAVTNRASSKVLAAHLDRQAVVYVRQSSPHQVLENRESTARQYALVQNAVALGWSPDRVVVIDDDLGKSGRTTEGRDGFQRLVREVTLNHVGMVFGLEMSRLARSSKDWHALFEMCGVYGTLLADEDGVYDANDANDRLLLGLKGIMSEMELHLMRNRLERGRLNKAQRGELFCRVPLGYVILPTGEVDFDPNEQAREVVQLLFDKFDCLGTIYGLLHWLVGNDIQLPVRARSGGNTGQLEWRRPTPTTLRHVLGHPIYAGAYAYGRRATDARNSKQYRPELPMAEWQVLIQDRLPAYITWEQYLKNRERIEQNRNGPGSRGTPRDGCALLAGLLTCGHCGRRMHPGYTNAAAQYTCNRHYQEATEIPCCGLAARAVDELVSQQVLRALEPAALELSMQACENAIQERRRLEKHWQQRLQQARYDVELAERRYQAVDPENRLVASTLETRWEESLCEQRRLQEEHDRFLCETPLRLSDDERAHIERLTDIPTLWNAERTGNAARKEIIRCLVERVVVNVRSDTELVDATINWAGGYESQHEIIRTVANYAQLHDFERLAERLKQLRAAGHSAEATAEKLNAEGFYPPKRRDGFTATVVYNLLKRLGLIGDERAHDELLGAHEWWLTDLASELKMSSLKLREWAKRDWVHSRKTPVQGRWILWADNDEVTRLGQLVAQSRRGVGYSSELHKPKRRPIQDKSATRADRT